MMKFKPAYILILSIGLLTCLPGPGFGATINVPADQLTIQAAINAAVSGADEVVIADNTYTGAGNINLSFNGKSITVRSASNNPAGVIIDVQSTPNSRGIIFENAEQSTAVLQGVTIRNGNADFGGGIRIRQGFAATGASPTIINCIIENNTAQQGGGVNISDSGSSPTFRNVTIRNNSATVAPNIGVGGGGLRAVGTATVTIISSLIDNNTSTASGGGILIDRATLRLSITTVSNNSANRYNGGGIAISGIPDGQANAYIHNANIFANSAWEKGGGLRFNHVIPSNTLEVVNSLIYDNDSSNNGLPAPGDGAAIDAWQASPTIINSTITNNTDLQGNSVIFVHTEGSPALTTPLADITINNSIVHGNTGGQLFKEVEGAGRPNSTSVSVSYSDVEDNSFAGINGNINLPPLFTNTGIDDYTLQVTSPALDRGDNLALPVDIFDLDNDTDVGEDIPSDLANNDRRYDIQAIADLGNGSAPVVDMGAYERSPIGGAMRFSAASYSVSEGAGTIRLTVVRTGDDSAQTSVSYATTAGTANSGIDFTSSTGQRTWNANVSGNQFIDIPITDDATGEANETFQVALSLNSPEGTLGIYSLTIVTINDDDGGINPGGGAGGAGGGGGGGGGCFITSLFR